MFIAELFTEAQQPQLVVFYPGRFQPFHLGHRDVFASLQAKFGRDNVFIATSNKVELPKSPFNFSDKTVFMNAAGVSSDRIIEVVSPYKLPEQFNPSNTIFVVAVGAPDARRLNPGGYKKDGSPGYFQHFESIKKCKTADQHGYVIIADERHKEITLKGQPVDVSHGTPSRAAWNMVRDDAEGRAEYLKQMFGRNDPEVGRVLDKIPVNEDINMDQSDSISPIHGGVNETIRQVKGGYRLLSKKGKNLGTYPTHAGAEKRERQVQYFKHAGESVAEGEGRFQTNIDTDSHDFNRLLYMIRNDYPVPRGVLMKKVMMNGQWLDPDEVKELVQSGELWSDLGYGQTGYNIKGTGPGEGNVAEDAAGVGVVKNSKDPRYVMATMGDQNDVTAATLPKMMKAYSLTGRTPPKAKK